MIEMLKIKQANKKDNEQILEILKKLDLYYSDLSLNNFWVAEKDKKIIGCVQLREYDDFLFLGSLGVSEQDQKHGIARALMDEILSKAPKNIYLYTIIPEFFKKFGFKTTKELPANLPSRNQYECEACHSDRCVTMVKAHAS